MKRLMISLGLFFVFAVSRISAEGKNSGENYPVPAEMGVFFSLIDGNLVPLEQTVGVTKTKGGTGAFFSSLVTVGTYSTKIKVVVVLKGPSSPVRVALPRPVFLLKVSPGLDIKSFELVVFKSIKNRREITGAEAGGFLGLQLSEGGYATVPFSIESHPSDTQTLLIRPKIDLLPGEYGFSQKTSSEVQCFGVDKAS